MEFYELRNLLISDRTVRRFQEEKSVAADVLKKVVELSRYCHSGRNAQPLKYIIITAPEERKEIFPELKWAGYYPDWDGPEQGERPSAYLIQCLDTRYGKNCLCDDGLQLEAITLGLKTLGLGSCIIKAFNAPAISRKLEIEERYEPRYVVAIGYPAEVVALEDMDGSTEADFKYYRTADGVHHVPKRPLSELVLKG